MEYARLAGAIADRFPGAVFVFDTISDKEVKQGQGQVNSTDNDTKLTFYLNDAAEELPQWNKFY